MLQNTVHDMIKDASEVFRSMKSDRRGCIEELKRAKKKIERATRVVGMILLNKSSPRYDKQQFRPSH